MNHQSAAAYAAQMEKIEQNITLCLQEIDHNFATCHRIVTTRLLPKVEAYGDSSKNVWNGSRFWKHFFEASANVSLSGYRDEENEADITATMPKTHIAESYDQSPSSPSLHGNIAEDSFMASMSLGVKSSTPIGKETTWAQMPSPFEDMKKDLKENFDIESSISSSVRDLEKRQKEREIPPSATSSVFSTKDKYSSSPISSPVKPLPKGPPGSATPHLLKQVLYKNLRENKTPRAAHQAPLLKIADAAKTPSRFITPADIEDMEFPLGMSPPVTLQFSMPPSKLAKTPAKEAAQYLVRDILMTAGSPVPPTPESLLKEEEDNKRELFDMVEEDEDEEEEPMTMMVDGPVDNHDDSFDIAVTNGIKDMRLSLGTNSAFAPLEQDEDDEDDDDEPGAEDTLFGARPAARMTMTPLKFKAPDELLGQEQTGQFTDNIESPCPPALRGDL